MISLPPPPEKPQCRHHNDADNCLLCGTKKLKNGPNINLDRVPNQHGDIPHFERVLTPEETAVVLEEGMRRQFGLPPMRSIEERLEGRAADIEQRGVVVLAKPELSKGFNGLRGALQLDRQDIVELFDRVVYKNVRFVEVETSVANDVLERRIARLKKIIQRSKELIESWSVRVMTIRRSEDNVLDKVTREKFKRDENARIARSNVKLARYRTALRSGGYKGKVWQYAQVPTYFRDILDDKMTFIEWGEAKYIEGEQKSFQGLPTHTTTELVQEAASVSGEYSLELYSRVLLLGDDALRILGKTESEQKISWANWRKWEDAVIGAAIRCGALPVNPELAGTLNLLGLRVELVPDEIEADTTEDALAIKTGGACYGSRIKGPGVRFRNGRFRQRALESFDKGAPLIDSGMEWESNDSTADSTSDDYESQAL